MPENSQSNTPLILIILTWALVIFSFFPASAQLGQAGMLLLSLGTLVLGIILIIIKNRAARTNGIIITAIWIITFSVGLVIGLSGKNPWGF